MLECKIDTPRITYTPFSPKEIYTNSRSPLQTNVSLKTAVTKICDFCKNEGVNLLQCSRCKRVHYCGLDCQKAAWKVHHIACKNAPFIPKDDELVCKFEDEHGNILTLTQKEFHKKINALYVHHPLFSNKTRELARKYSTGQKLNVKDEIAGNIALKKSDRSDDHYVIALKEIQKAKQICSFGGQVIPEKKWEGALNFSHKAKMCSTAEKDLVFDSSRYTSLGGLINDGPPNCKLATDYISKSFDNLDIPIEKVLISTRKIKKGQALCIDYGIFHPIKRGTYQLDENTLNELYQNHGSIFDMTTLAETGWVFNTIKTNEKYQIKNVKSAEIQYILSTPYALAMLHLNTGLKPSTTLNHLNQIKQKLFNQLENETEDSKNKIHQTIEQAEDILIFLSKISKMDRQGFSNLVQKYSQQAFAELCESLREIAEFPSLKDCEKFCALFDKMKILFVGTLSGCFWNCSEKSQFEEQFFSKNHQKKLFDLSEAEELPFKLEQDIYKLHEKFFDLISSKLSLEKQKLLKNNQDRYFTIL